MILRSESRWCSVPPPSTEPLLASTAASASNRPWAASSGNSSIEATRPSRSNAGRFPASQSSGSVKAGRIASTSSTDGKRKISSPARSPSAGTDRRITASGETGSLIASAPYRPSRERRAGRWLRSGLDRVDGAVAGQVQRVRFRVAAAETGDEVPDRGVVRLRPKRPDQRDLDLRVADANGDAVRLLLEV